MENQIKNNPTFDSMTTLMDSIKLMNSFLEENLDSRVIASEKITEIVQHFSEVSTLPDKYNELFSDNGWIAHESLSLEVMKSAIQIAEDKSIDDAEDSIIEYYENNYFGLLNLLKSNTLEAGRVPLIKKSYKCYLKKEYEFTVLMMLSQIDGHVNDVIDTGFFARKTDLEVWDSIAAHSTGLNKVKKMYGKSREKFNSEKILKPYRNGIMHGRDINYGNKQVAMKSLVLLIYVLDWHRAKSTEEERKDKYFSNIRDLSNYDSRQFLKDIQKLQNEKGLLEEWTPRLSIDVNNLQQNSPEEAVSKYFEYIMHGNYGKAAKLSPNIDIKSLPGKIRKKYENLALKIRKFKITEVRDVASAKSDVKVCLLVSRSPSNINHSIEYNCELELSVIYFIDGKSENRLVSGGDWRLPMADIISDLISVRMSQK